MYFRVYNKSAKPESYWTLGYLSPDGNHKSYACWKWVKKWYGGYYKQYKPWRTISLETNWPASVYLEDSNFSLKLIEYDPPIYDWGESSQYWCSAAAIFIPFAPTWPGVASLTLLTLACVWYSDDDMIGCGDYFENIVVEAYENSGQEIIWDAGHYRITIIVE